MILKIDKKIEGGSYRVEIAALSFTPEEQQKITTFGSPLISIAPKNFFNGNTFLTSLPIHIINHSFTFNDEAIADKFVIDIKQRIKDGMNELRSKKDGFTEEKEYEL